MSSAGGRPPTARGAAAITPVAHGPAEIARTGEPDRYLAAILAPAEAQQSLIAVAAFVAELARIPAAVSDPMIGEIRLQWWRDAIADVHRGVATAHPVADALAPALGSGRLSLPEIHRLIDARSFDLTGDLHADDAALERYLGDTEGIPFAMAWSVLSGETLPRKTAVAAGIAYGLARSLGRLPALLHNGGFPIPETRLASQGVSRAMLAEHPPSKPAIDGVEAASRDLEQRARQALAEVRQDIATERRGGLPALFSLAMVEPYFAAQKQQRFRRLEHMLEVVPLNRVWRIGLARLRGRI